MQRKLIRSTPLRRTRMRPWRRDPEDKVPHWLPGYLLARDRGCLAPMLARANDQPIDACDGRMTVEHVKFESQVGKRAPSDKYHCLTLCLHHNLTWALTSEHKNFEREYLERIEGKAA